MVLIVLRDAGPDDFANQKPAVGMLLAKASDGLCKGFTNALTEPAIESMPLDPTP
ncbi:MAG: hypothetical protein U0361_12920 [Nitrospiraceae bacterium]